MHPELRNIIFDLDGTLVDSSPGILASLAHVLEKHGIEPRVSLTRNLIGPPLAATMARITGIERSDCLQDLIAGFIAHYDSLGYLVTPAYSGVAHSLTQLAQLGWPLYIATNKRIAPTRKILAYLGWDKMFAGVYASDLFTPLILDKCHLLSELISREQLDPYETAYVGDTHEDAYSAAANRLHFFAACWGYGGLDQANTSWTSLVSSVELLGKLGVERS